MLKKLLRNRNIRIGYNFELFRGHNLMFTKNDQFCDPQPAPSAKMNNRSLFKNKKFCKHGANFKLVF